jgi:hypothetical protein
MWIQILESRVGVTEFSMQILESPAWISESSK